MNRPQFGEDRRWLAVMAAATAVELLWWSVCWKAGAAPLPYPATYLALSCAALAVAIIVRRTLSNRPVAWAAVFVGTVLVALGASLFLPLKYAIPHEVPFWLDRPLARGEHALFGADPWLLLDRLLGWAAVPVDRIYGVWLPVQSLALFAVMLAPPSPAKSRALIAYVLAWFLLGALAATILSSAGPIFYDRLFGGDTFAPLAARLRTAGASMAVGESDAMWASFASHRPGLVAGMSAVPSMHVAISVWMVLAARALAPRLATYAAIYATFIWIASVQLGWHYATDGLAGAAGMVLVWQLACRVDRKLGGAPTPIVEPRSRD